MAALITKLSAAVRRDEEGQGLAEYALILALIAIVVIAAVIFLGGQINTIMSNVGDQHLTSAPSNLRRAAAPPGAAALLCPRDAGAGHPGASRPQ